MHLFSGILYREKLVVTPRNNFWVLRARYEKTWRPCSSASSSAALYSWHKVGEMARLTLKKGAAPPNRPAACQPTVCISAIWAGRRATHKSAPPPQPLSLTPFRPSFPSSAVKSRVLAIDSIMVKVSTLQCAATDMIQEAS